MKINKFENININVFKNVILPQLSLIQILRLRKIISKKSKFIFSLEEILMIKDIDRTCDKYE